MSGWFSQLAQRLIWAHRALVTDTSVIQLDNGISLDLTTNQVILEGDFALHVTGNLSLTAGGYLHMKDHTRQFPTESSGTKDSDGNSESHTSSSGSSQRHL